MERTGHCIHATVLSSYRTVVTVSIPSFNGSHNGRPTKNYKTNRVFPSGGPPNLLKYDT